MANHLLGRIILGIAALSLLSFVGADFAQCLPEWEWSYNSMGLNPCQIAGSLQAPCMGYSVYTLVQLPYGSNYITPQKNDTLAKSCGCNTIIYSLYAACSSCQFNSSYTPLTWTFWSQFCDNVTVTQYPISIPYNTSVPHWTFLDDTNPGFNSVLAQAAGRDPEATPKSPPTVSLSTPGTNTSPNFSSTATTGGGGGGGTNSNTGAIAGGVVGGVVGLALVATFLLKRRRGSGDPNAILSPNPMRSNNGQFYKPPKLYNPADPSTYPALPSGGDSANSGGYTTNPYKAGRYNGAAEL